MAGPSTDVKSLKELLNGGASWDELSGRSIEIHERLLEEEKFLNKSKDLNRLYQCRTDMEEFERIKKLIVDRRGEGALSRYNEWCKASGIT